MCRHLSLVLMGFELTVLTCCEEVNIGANMESSSLAHLNSVCIQISNHRYQNTFHSWENKDLPLQMAFDLPLFMSLFFLL